MRSITLRVPFIIAVIAVYAAMAAGCWAGSRM
jgi:hypothetical protein